MLDQPTFNALASLMALNLELEGLRLLPGLLVGGDGLVAELPQASSRIVQAHELLGMLARRGLIDGHFFALLVDRLPGLYAAIAALAERAGLPRPARPPPRDVPSRPGVRLPVLCVTAIIGRDVTKIFDEEIREALRPDEPDGPVTRIDLAAACIEDTPQGWAAANEIVQRDVRGFLNYTVRHHTPGPVPVFAFAPIPVLCAVGLALGNKVPIRIMQRYNKFRPAWGWYTKAPPGGRWERPLLRRPGADASADVGLLLSVSGHVDLVAAEAVLPPDAPVWEIRLKGPDRDQIRTEAQLARFRELFDATVTRLQRQHGRDLRLHVFPAVPLAIGVALGNTLLRNTMPSVHLYEYRRVQDRGTGSVQARFLPAITLDGPTLAV